MSITFASKPATHAARSANASSQAFDRFISALFLLTPCGN